MFRFVLVGVIDRTVDSTIDVEDSGQALIAQIDGDDPNFFVKLQSWDESAVDTDGTVGHRIMNSLRGKRVRVTVEVIDD